MFSQEYEQLMKENESMQKKLMSQEEEFQLQNETLLRELAQVSRSLFWENWLRWVDPLFGENWLKWVDIRSFERTGSSEQIDPFERTGSGERIGWDFTIPWNLFQVF